MAQAVLEYVPPLIRESLVCDSDFRQDYGFHTEAVIALGESGLSIPRAALFDAIRGVLTDSGEANVTDAEGSNWQLQRDVGDDGQTNLILSSGEQQQILPDFRILAADLAPRIQSLEEAASDVNLPIASCEEWRSILADRALEDDEVDPFHKDIRDTPVHLERSIGGEILAGKSSVTSLVPSSRRYYERLVGAFDGSASINEYAAGAGRDFFKQLMAWRPYEGFLFSLFLSSHSTLTSEISVDDLDSESLARAYDFIEKFGDTVSRLGAIEIGLRLLPDRPEVEPYLLPLVSRIRDDDVESTRSEFKLLSSLFVLVDGELSRLRLMSEEPPFYRRLASLAQASLIQRQLVRHGIDYQDISEWAFSARAEQYYVQSLADMRIEPRWNPDLAAAPQMKADFFGRIMIAAKSSEKDIGASELNDVVLGTTADSLSALSEFPYPYLPGPLEGAENSPNALPDELEQAIERQLNTDEIGPTSFVALVNSAQIFKLPAGQAEMAAKALKLGNYRLSNVGDKEQLLGILSGLATVASVSRNTALSDELRILVRVYRHDPQFGLSVEDSIRICLASAASHEDLVEWCSFVGEWFTELAFDEFEANEGSILESYLHALLLVVPELWHTCARADAALQAYCAR